MAAALTKMGLALVFVAILIYGVTSRTALLVVPVLFFLMGLQRFGRRSVLVLLAAGIAVGIVGWTSSPQLRSRVFKTVAEFQSYQSDNDWNSTALRLEFVRKSVRFFADAPLIGHGTGAIKGLFERATAGRAGAEGAATENPHNQTLSVAVQLGLVGVLVLYAMWCAQLLLFRGEGLAAWIGMGVVVQAIIMSLFNSNLFDFSTGWIYVFSVGVLGGLVLPGAGASRNPPTQSVSSLSIRPAVP
jgi:O-antigen ligase